MCYVSDKCILFMLAEVTSKVYISCHQRRGKGALRDAYVRWGGGREEGSGRWHEDFRLLYFRLDS